MLGSFGDFSLGFTVQGWLCRVSLFEFRVFVDLSVKVKGLKVYWGLVPLFLRRHSYKEIARYPEGYHHALCSMRTSMNLGKCDKLRC